MKYWLGIILVGIGLAVGVISLYFSSLSGVMNKMGLVGGGLVQSVNLNELARRMRGVTYADDCGFWTVTKKVPGYLGMRGEERVRLAGELGRERIGCGIRYVQNQNVERGVYTIVKGLYYLKNQYGELRGMVENNRDDCALLGSVEYGDWVEGYLMATEGRAHQVVLEVYKEVERERAGVEELCIE